MATIKEKFGVRGSVKIPSADPITSFGNTIIIKGEKGERGDPGIKGIPGRDGSPGGPCPCSSDLYHPGKTKLLQMITTGDKVEIEPDIDIVIVKSRDPVVITLPKLGADPIDSIDPNRDITYSRILIFKVIQVSRKECNHRLIAADQNYINATEKLLPLRVGRTELCNRGDSWIVIS